MKGIQTEIDEKRLFWLALSIIVIFSLPTLFYTGAWIVLDGPAPKEGMEESPYVDEPLTDGLLLLVLDGGRKDGMSNPDLMPELNRRVADGAYLEVRTNPLTMTASCVKEMATGVQSRPNEGMNNFHPVHPGTPDGYNLASTIDRDGDGVPDHKVGILGDYVWTDLYPDRDLIPYAKHRYGHGDYYQGDEEGFETLGKWVSGEVPEGHDRAPNIIVAHLAGLDSVGHRWGSKDSAEYDEKLQWIDDQLKEVLLVVPDNWTVIVTSDHGATDDGQHGSPDDVIRDVALFMWGPNIAEGVHIEGVAQRDIATLPSALFSLPLPHAIHGRIPVDAFAVSDERKQVMEQWNWDAAVARNEWLKEEGYPYVEGLSSTKIEWERLPVEGIGARDLDLWMAGAASITILVGVAVLAARSGVGSRTIAISSLGVVAIGFISSFMASNRDEYASEYYDLGALFSLLFFIPVYILGMKKSNEDDGRWMICLTLLSALMLMYSETRLSNMFLILWFLLAYRWVFRSSEGDSPRMLRYAFLLVLIPAIFFSHYRALGFSLTRRYVSYSLSVLPHLVATSCALAAGGALFFLHHQKQARREHKVGLALFFASIPLLLSFESNYSDWLLLLSTLSMLGYGIHRYRIGAQDDLPWITLSALSWLTICWGAWAGMVSMVILACTSSLLENEWRGVPLLNAESNYSRWAGYILMGCLPIAIWFAWWASLGQLTGFLHPRDIDPGNLYLRGGYVGDRVSPSNMWVGFMGVGPIAVVSLALFRLFHRAGWCLEATLAFLALRISFHSLQLPFAPELPRLVFKLAWDIIYLLILMLLIIVVRARMYIDWYRNQSSDEATAT